MPTWLIIGAGVIGILGVLWATSYALRRRQDRPPHKERWVRDLNQAGRGRASEPTSDSEPPVAVGSAAPDEDDPAASLPAGEWAEAPGPPRRSRADPSARFANVKVRDARLSPHPILEPGEALFVDVSIGPLSRESDVARPVPFPDETLPEHDLWLDVLLSSSDFHVALALSGLDRHTSAVEARMLLPRGGGRALTEDGGRTLRFVMRPRDETGVARARLSYLYRNTVVQSQCIDVELMLWRPLKPRVTTDFTISQRLGAELDGIASRSRVTVITNERQSAHHEITVRAADANGTQLTEPEGFAIRHEAIAPCTAKVRETLDGIAPTKRARSRSHLVRDLQRLAPLGWRLYTSLSAPVQQAVRLASTEEDAVVQVVLPLDSTFTVPWAFVYDTFLDSDVRPEQLPVCPVVGEWDERSALVPGEARRCPRESTVDHHENILCPFGFWGYRHSFEVITSSDRPKPSLRFPGASRVVVAETRRGVDRKALAGHVEQLRGIFAKRIPGTVVIEADTKAGVREAVENDIPIVYFLCHGYKNGGGTGTTLGVGENERISPSDINGWIDVAMAKTGWRMWTDPQPLVLINACESLAIEPDDLVDYVGAFVGKANAVGVIGTEVKVSQSLAMTAAEEFFSSLITSGASVGEALRRVKDSFLSAGNLFGLVYTPYCFADLRVAE